MGSRKVNQRQLSRSLIDAIVKRDMAVVQSSLRNGANVNFKDKEHGETPLMLAAQFGDAEMLLLLLDRGAEIDEKDDAGRTALSHSFGRCLLNRQGTLPDVLQVLLDSGADVNSRDNAGKTVLMWGIQTTADPVIVRMLLDNGADATASEDDGQTALEMANDYGFTGISDLLRERVE